MEETTRSWIVAGTLAAIASISTSIYFFLPQALEILSFSGHFFLQGEVWRLLSFPFVHASLSHLAQNMIALFVILLLALEISILGHQVLATFFGASFVVAFADVVAFPWMIIAGASVGVYALFGALAAKGSGFLSSKAMVPLLGIPLLIQIVLSVQATRESWASALLHIAGFIIGVAAFTVLRLQTKEKIRVLEVAPA